VNTERRNQRKETTGNTNDKGKSSAENSATNTGTGMGSEDGRKIVWIQTREIMPHGNKRNKKDMRRKRTIRSRRGYKEIFRKYRP